MAKNPADRMEPIVFPDSMALYCNLQEPDRYQPESGPPRVEYRVQIRVDDNPEWQEFFDKAVAFHNERKEWYARQKEDWDDGDYEEWKEDNYIKKPSFLKKMKYKDERVQFIKIHSKFKDKFQVVDKNNQPTTDEPWGGSIVKVAALPEFYEGFGGGITLYLNKVMIVENSRDAGSNSPPAGEYKDPFASESGPSGSDIPF